MDMTANQSAFHRAAVAAEKLKLEIAGSSGIVDVRPGYLVRDGWFTNTPAVVVTVARKDPAAPPLPRECDGVPVDVAPATPAQQLIAAGLTGQVGALLAAAAGHLQVQPRRDSDIAIASVAAAGLEALAVPSITYVPPAQPLAAVSSAMKLLCHVSPDAGWPTLRHFLQATRNHLTIAIYEFAAPHIADTLRDLLQNNPDLSIRLIADAGKDPLGATDVDEEDLLTGLRDDFAGRFEFVWAAVAKRGKVSAEIFKTAYHIKVAVRDGEAFWLSSGNWKSSNQPDTTFVPGPNDVLPSALTKRDRDVHIVVENVELAGLFETYILHDIEQTTPLQVEEGAQGFNAPDVDVDSLPDLLVPEGLVAAASVAARPAFPPQQFEFTAGEVTVQPLLSPDNFASQLLKLVRSANRSLYIQNQYIKARNVGDMLDEIVDAIVEECNAGLDVRIILRDLGRRAEDDTRQMITALIQRGIEPVKIRLQPELHAKLVMVDSSVVLVGSHNWSQDGVLANRDASLIIQKDSVAAYYQGIFLWDWENLAMARLPEERFMPRVAQIGEATPDGFVRSAWADFYEG